MATRKVADHTLYHLSPKGFWKKFREFIFVIMRAEIVANVSE